MFYGNLNEFWLKMEFYIQLFWITTLFIKHNPLYHLKKAPTRLDGAHKKYEKQ